MIKRIGKVAYQLQLPATTKIHSVFHVSQLKKAVGQEPVSATIPDQLTTDMEMVGEPEQVMDVRKRPGSSDCLEVLIKWKQLPVFEATWEEARALGARFPDFHLEDKVKLWAPGNVMKATEQSPVLTYARKKYKGRKVIAGDKGKEVSLQ